MDPVHLRTLRELRDRGSVTAVAQAMHLSASAVSQQLAALQRAVGDVPLTRQQGRVLVLTPAGHRLADAAGDVLGALARARETVQEYLSEPAATVSVTAFHSVGLAWFPQLIAATLAAAESDPAAPTVHCRDEDVSIDEFPDLVADHDIVIAHRPLASSPWPERRVTATPLLIEPIDLALAADHPLARLDRIQLADLADATWLAAHEGFALEPLLVQAHAATTGRPIEIAHRVNEFNVAAGIIASTSVIGLLPRHTGLPDAYRDRVVLRPIADLTLGRHVDALTRPESAARRSVQTVIERLKSIAAATEDAGRD
ncbi:LysR family transcriptional regulator [Schumannella luteola]|uniref:DNA-binding transcriptional LysR family regulator n=1 Tax=Schumannella luteola TaxID=472059 RepID=A0A852YNX8_9MICO|nr:LysR family transcriptional regulator [Schumannella luteola]NYG98915.1 DNA-binding transcriptional LysR family regulator [Schumannella luteola]TPX06293.1 LysR family transcriptional regulator [Schumannella luteola]